MIVSGALFSEDRAFRYWLFRAWNPSLPFFAVIGTNPSVAAELQNDPTIRKVIGFGERLGYGGVLMLNVGAFVATDPKDWRNSRDPFGPENTIEHLSRYLVEHRIVRVIAAWGVPCTLSTRGRLRAALIGRAIPSMKCWGRNANGSPRHPLMLPYSTELEPFN